MTEKQLLTARTTAEAVGAALRDNTTESADRLITELLGRVIDEPGDIPAQVLEEPASTGDVRYDTLLATGLAYALATRGIPALPWMTAVPASKVEWLWDGDADSSPEFRAYIRRQTPPMFLDKGLLLRDRDIRIL